MGAELKLGIVGAGRIGVFHAQHVQEIAAERGDCALSAVIDAHEDTAARVAARLQERQRGRCRVANAAARGGRLCSRGAFRRYQK